jgi:hypothetical protein
MNKYIQDFIKNQSRFLLTGLTKPQCKAISEIIRGFFVVSKPILRKLAQNPNKTAKKQGEKYAYHLGNLDLSEKVEEFSIKRVRPDIRKNTIISYDLTDIAKEFSKKIDHIRRIFDGSKRKVTNGFLLHGVGVNGILLKLGIHDGDRYTLNQVRKKIIRKLAKEFHSLGIWVFDRGNDDKAFFKYLRHKLKLQFIARLRSNRGLVIAKTGAIMKVSELPPGRYEVFLMNKYNTKVDLRYKYLLVIRRHLKNKTPIRLLCYLKDSFSSKQIVTMYLERWGIEDSFKRAKQKFNLEQIRVLDHQKFVNLVALVQFATNLCTMGFLAIQRFTNSLISGVIISYRKFLHLKSVSFNLTSFISFLQFSLKPLIIRSSKSPPKQLPLLSRRSLEKLGSF